ncbi:hypothetical protein NKH84_03955 [Mesorhizobium sp. M0902]|uniref:hypothetical protein n=1 Tax=unclassified Mesorhizobium TaxID=325217 RepID=UPI00333AEA98
MAARKSIETAPKDGSKVTVYWQDSDGVMNESIAQYRSLDRLKAAGGDWDESDAGWWAYTDGHTQRKIEPIRWRPASDDPDADD